MKLTLHEIAKVVGAKNDVTAYKDVALNQIEFDSRKITAGDLFLPLKGARDGHDFIQTAFDNGAIATFTEKELLAMTKSGSTIKEEISKIPTIKLQLIDGSTYAMEGKVDAITGVIDQSTGSVSIRAIFPNKEHVLRSGGTANVLIPYNMENVISIPQSATVEIQDKKFVYVLQPDNTLKYTEIGIFNLDNGKEYLVTSGLNAGDKIVIEGVQNLKDGQKIQPITPAQKEANYQQHLKDQHDGNLATAFN